MNRILVVTLTCAAMAISTGCKPLSFRSRSDEEPSQTAEQKQIKQLQDEVATLKDRIAIRDSQEKELRRRADALAEKVRKLEFVNQQQANQIKVLSQAPLARDEYKTLAEQLKTSLERVTARLAKLEASNKLLTLQMKMASRDKAAVTVLPTTAPATVWPTTKPATVLPTSKIRRGGITPVTTAPAPEEEF